MSSVRWDRIGELAERRLARGYPPPVPCARCGRLNYGALYIEAEGSRKGRSICSDCNLNLELRREWKRRERLLWQVSSRKPPERIAEKCAVCGRMVHRPHTVPWRYDRPPVCSKWCRRKQRREKRRVKHDPIVCVVCGESFIPTRSDAKTCTGPCRVRLHRQRKKLAEGR